jgi:hypothetical protein
MGMDSALLVTLGIAASAGIWKLVTVALRVQKGFNRIEFILTGADGENGIRSDVQAIKKGQSEHSENIKDIKRTLHGEHPQDENALVNKITVIERRFHDLTPNPGLRSTDKPKKRKRRVA